MALTGRVIYQNLEEYDINTGTATGNVKPNIESDPDYIPPHTDNAMCGLGTISVTPTHLTYPFDGGSKVVSVEASSPWTATKTTGGMSPMFGSAGTTEVTITMLTTAHDTEQYYEFIFTLDNGADSTILNVTQEPNESTGGGKLETV